MADAGTGELTRAVCARTRDGAWPIDALAGPWLRRLLRDGVASRPRTARAVYGRHRSGQGGSGKTRRTFAQARRRWRMPPISREFLRPGHHEYGARARGAACASAPGSVTNSARRWRVPAAYPERRRLYDDFDSAGTSPSEGGARG